MKRSLSAIVALVILAIPLFTWSQPAGLKAEAVQTIERERGALNDLSLRIWNYAELALREKQSSRDLCDFAEKRGFTVERGVAGMPTAFIAEYGSGKPIIGIIGEYDALPGLSQKVTSHKEALVPNGTGHGCGHNLLGVGSMGAAVAVKELIAAGKLKGTVRYYGTPAEESIGGKVYMTREGLFDDVDVCLGWHPSGALRADTESALAIVCILVEFNGKTAHAAADPWDGKSALDGAELFAHGLNMLREHVRPSVRMHYIFSDGGLAANIVPDRAEVSCFLRDWKHTGVDDLLVRVKKIAKGAALMADVESKLTVTGGYYETLINEEGSKLLHENLELLGPIEYTEEENAFAREVQQSLGVKERDLNGELSPLVLPPPPPSRGSTDLGDVSWRSPLIHLRSITMPKGTPGHSWAVTACGGMSIGEKGTIHAAKALALTAIDLYVRDDVRSKVRDEFEKKAAGFEYKSYNPDGPPILPED